MNIFSTNNSDELSNDWGLEVVFGDRLRDSAASFYDRQLHDFAQSHISTRLVGLLTVALIMLGAIGWQVWRLQVVRGQALAVRSQFNTLSSRPLFAPRGSILDKNGETLAFSYRSTSTDYFQRQYATSTGMGHLLGYISYPQRDSGGNFYRVQSVGEAGVEAGFNERLSAQPGRQIYETNAVGQIISESTVSQPKSGETLRLTIDSAVQEKLFALIQQTAQDYDYTGGAGVIMNINTGGLVAAASYPGFDPNRIMQSNSYLQSLQSATGSPFLNRVSEGRFTPGSIVKPFVAAAALNEEVVSPGTTIVSTGQLRVPNPYETGEFTIFEDWKAHGPVQLREAIAVSSNVYFYQIGGGFKDQAGLGIDNIVKYSRGFGLGKQTGIKGFSEISGIIPTPKWKQKNFSDGTWRVGDTYNTAIGQFGYQVTPLQVIRAVSGIATGGDLVTPKLAKHLPKELTSVQPDISPADYQVVRDGMRRAVASEKGTAHNLDVEYTSIAAKTGTAQLGGKAGGINSWIIGYWPATDPQYAFTTVMSDGPSSNVVGGLFVMRRLFDWMNRNHPNYFPDKS